MKHTVFMIAAAFTVMACQDVTEPAAMAENAPDAQVGVNGDTPCVGTLRGTYDNVHVPVGKTCTLQNATVKGNVIALPSSRLYVNSTTVKGNIDGDEAVLVHVRGGRVEGSIQIKEANSPSVIGASVTGGTVLTQGNIQIEKMNTGGIVITDVVLTKGTIKVEENTTRTRFEIARNKVGQNVQVFTNRGSNRKYVRNNTISQIVQCKDNLAPFTGGPNQAGDAQDQCF